MHLTKAQVYLKDVLAHRRVVPFRRFCGKLGRTPQATEWGVTIGKSAKEKNYKFDKYPF
jgi:large subunit ribosomal protein L17e